MDSDPSQAWLTFDDLSESLSSLFHMKQDTVVQHS